MTDEIQALIERIEQDELTLDALIAWLDRPAHRESGATFKPCDSCECPLSRYLSERYDTKIPIEVGDDDICVDGYYCRPTPEALRYFVRWFDMQIVWNGALPTAPAIVDAWRAR